MPLSRAQPEAAARPAGDEGAGAGDRHGRRRRRGDVRDVPVELRFAARAREQAYYERAALRRRLRVAEARAAARGEPRSPPCRASRRSRHAVVADVTLDLPRLDGAGHRPPDLDPGRSAAARQRSVPAPRPLDRAGPPRRGPGQRRRSPTAHSSSPATGSPARHQRPAAPAEHRRHGAVARVRLQRSGRASSCPDDRRFGIFWMDRQRARPPPSTWRAASTTSSLRARARRRPAETSSPRLDRTARAVRRPRRDSAGAAALALDARERARAAAELRLHAAADLPAASRRSS